MKRFLMSVPDHLHKKLVRKKESLGMLSIQETIRYILQRYLEE